MSRVQQLITARAVLPGPAGQHIREGAVLIDDDTITAVGPRHAVEPLAADDVIRHDYPRHTVLPGLINAHVHLCFDGSSDLADTVQRADPDILLHAMAGRALQLLDAGVTTVRDLGDRDGLAIRLRDAIAAGRQPGPRIVAAGAPLTTANGHCWFLGGEVRGEEEIRRRVQDTAAAGADVIKVMVSGGQITQSSPPMWQSQFSTAELRVVVDEATAAGLPVAAHAHGTDAIASAVDAEVSTIEHCTWLRPGGGGYETRDHLARRMAERGIHACVAWPPNWRGFMNRLGADRAEQVTARFRWMDELGVSLLPGTDAGLRNSPFDDFASALELYEHLGFPPARVIEMATVTNSHALGLAARVGTLAPGYSADLLVVNGDPLTSLGALHHRDLVLVRGQVHR